MQDEMKDILLKECYELSERFETMDVAKNILREKSKKINLLKEPTSQSMVSNLDKSYMQKVTDVIYELTMESFVGNETKDFKLNYVVNSLPMCAEKNYLLALLALRKGTSETQRLSALQYVSSALAESPNDPRYRALAQILKDV